MAAERALHPDRKARGYSQKGAANATRRSSLSPFYGERGKSGRAKSPVFLAAPGTPTGCRACPISGTQKLFPAPHCEAFFAPRQNIEGMARQAARHLVVSHVPSPARGASRRAIAASLRRRAALSDVPFRPASGSETPTPFGWPRPSSLGQAWRPAVSQLLAGDRSLPGRSPGAARELGGCVHPPPAGAASDPTCMTPHDSALGGSDNKDYNPATIVLSSRDSGSV
jgi:hypothetical protein